MVASQVWQIFLTPLMELICVEGIAERERGGIGHKNRAS